jgi:hypothetical protein
MHWRTLRFGGVGLLSAALLVAGTAAAAPVKRTVSGTVTAVTIESRTIVVEAQVGGTTLVVGAEVPEGATIKGAKSLADIKAGDRVTLQYVRTEKGLTAESISRVSPK